MIFPTDIRARFLIGRPGAAMLSVGNDAELDTAAGMISAAYERAALLPPWPVHIVILHHNLRWGETRVDVSTAEEIGQAMAGMGGMNVG